MGTHTQHLGTIPASARASWLSVLQAFNSLVRALVLAGASIGLVLISRTIAATANSPDVAEGKLRFDGSRWITLALFLMPLFIISIDFVYDFSGPNELFICILNWTLLAAIVFQLVRSGQSPKGVFVEVSTCQAATEYWV